MDRKSVDAASSIACTLATILGQPACIHPKDYSPLGLRLSSQEASSPDYTLL